MTTTYDAKATEIGGFRHEYRMHGTVAGSEPDTGTVGGSPILAEGGTITEQLTGPLQDGTVSWCFLFNDGRIQRAQLSNTDFSPTSLGSICFWFKSSSPTNQMLWSTHPSNEAFRFALLSNGWLQFQVIHGADATTIQVQSNFADGAWHFVCLVCNNATANKIYVDGTDRTVVETLTGSGLGNHPWVGSINTASGVFLIGNDERWSTTDNFPFIGSMSRLAFVGFALSADNVNALWLAAFGAVVLPSGTPKRYLDLDLPMTNSVYMAQRLMYRKLLEADRQKTLQGKANMRAMQYAVGDVLTVSVADLLLAEKTYRVTSWRMEEDAIELGLIEDDANAYVDPIVSLYKQPPALATPTAGALQVPPPTGLTATPALEGIALKWTAPSNSAAVVLYLLYASPSSSWSDVGRVLIGYANATQFTHQLATTQTLWFWVRALDAFGNESDRSPNSDTSTVTATFTAGTTAVPSAPQSLGGIDGTPATGQLTGSFTRAGVTVASRIFTVTHSGGNLTYSAAADTGEPTTHSAVGSGTPTLVVTHRHTGSGQTTTLTFTVA